jgi:hypothetical protein
MNVFLRTATIPLALLFFSSCGLVDESCPSELTQKETSYFPHEVGRQWDYTYESRSGYLANSGPTGQETIGDMRWEVTAATDGCTHEDLTIAESFEGIRVEIARGEVDTTYALEWQKELHAKLDGSRLIIDGYADESPYRPALQWILQGDAPAEIRVDTLVQAGFGGAINVRYSMRRNVGITFWEYASGHRGDHNSEMLTLKP